MNCDDCALRLPEYVDGELDDPREIAMHVAACPDCSESLAALKRESALYARYHPDPEPAPDLWGRVEGRLGRRRVVEAWRRGLWRSAPALAVACAVLTAWVWWAYRPSQSIWMMARPPGPPFKERSSPTRSLSAGEWLRTSDGIPVTLIGKIGTIEIGPNSRLRLIESDEKRYRFRLMGGRIRATLATPAEAFFVETPAGVAEDLGCSFSLEVNGAGDTFLQVSTGWVLLTGGGRRSYIPAKARCKAEPGLGPGLPYFAGASPALVNAMSEIDFSRPQAPGVLPHRSARPPVLTPARRDHLISVILAQARPGDLLSLWNLLTRVPAADRGRIYDRMAALARTPFGVTREGIVRLDPAMFEQWRKLF